jgi:hypothetical protein
MTTDYVILLPGDEDVWAKADDETRAAVYARHEEFMTTLREHGHTVVGGAELAHSRDAKVVRSSGTGVTVTEGPYAETAEQLTGFYIVRTDDLDDLLKVCGILADAEGGVEVRATVASA